MRICQNLLKGESGKLNLSHPRRMRRESRVWFGSDGMAPPSQGTSQGTSHRDDWKRPRDWVSFREDPYDLEEFASSNLRRRSVDDEITSFDRCKQCDELLPIRPNLSLETPAHLETLTSDLKSQVVQTRTHRKSHQNGTDHSFSLIESSNRRLTTTSPDSNFAGHRSENTNTVALNDNLPAVQYDLPSASLPEFEESRLHKRRNKRRKHKKFNEAVIDALYEEARKNEDAIKMLYGMKAPSNVLNSKKSSRKMKQKHPISESCGGQEVFKRDISATKSSMSTLLDGKSLLVPEIDEGPIDLSTPFNDEEDDESVTVKVYESSVKISNNSLFSNLRFVPKKKNYWFKRVDRHDFDPKDPLQALSVDSDSEGIEKIESLLDDSRKYSYKNSSKNHESRLKYEKLPQRLAPNEYFAGVRMKKSNNGSDVSDINNTTVESSKTLSLEANIRELQTNSRSLTVNPAMQATDPFLEVKKTKGNSAKIDELDKNKTGQGETALRILVSNGEIKSADSLMWNRSSKASKSGKSASEEIKRVSEPEEGTVETITEDKDSPVNSTRELSDVSLLLKADMNQTEISKLSGETLVGLGSKMSTAATVAEKVADCRHTDSEFVTVSAVLPEIKTAKSNVTILTEAVVNKTKNFSVFPNLARYKNKPLWSHVNDSSSNVTSNHSSTETNTSRSTSSSSNASLSSTSLTNVIVQNRSLRSADLDNASGSSDGANRQLHKVKREDADSSYKTILHATGEINIRPINYSTFNQSFKNLASKSKKPFTFGRNSENMNFDDRFEQMFNQDHETHDSQDKINAESTHTTDSNEFNRFRIDSKQKKNNHSLSTPSKIVDSKDAQAISSELRRMIVEKSKKKGLQSSSLQNEQEFTLHPFEKSFVGNRSTSSFDTVMKSVDISSTTGSVRPGEEASDVDMKLEGIIGGKLPNQMVNSIFAKVNGNGKLVSDLGLGQVSLSSHESLEDLTVPNNQREGEVKKQAEGMMMSITRELTRLIQETSRKQGCYTLKPEMLNFLRWLVAPAPIKRDEESENLG